MSETPPRPRPPRTARKAEQTLDARLSETLIREIMEGRHAPGTWLREQEISNRHGVSRASVREALRNVAYAGFVDIQPWRGAQVAQISKAELIDIFRLLEQTYAQCAYWAAERYPEAMLGRLDKALVRMDAAVAAKASQAELDTLSFDLGQQIGRNSGSQLAYRLLVQVGNLALWQQRVLSPGDDHTAEQSLQAHRVLVSAIRACEPEVAESAARMIVIITRNTLQRSDFQAPPAPAAAKPVAKRRSKAAPT